MRILNIASSSSGNATYIGSENTHLLIDCGVSRKKIEEGLHAAELSLEDIDGILLTHEHTDHIKSFGVIERTRQIPSYATKGTIAAMEELDALGHYDSDVFSTVKSGVAFTVGDIKITPIGIRHDAAEAVAYRFDCSGKSCAVITDLGTFAAATLEAAKGLDALVLEANHDIRMLEAGRYPYPVKRRIAGANGHLSNESSGEFLSKVLHGGLKAVLLAHVSRENNTRELARRTVKAYLKENLGIGAGELNLNVARHDAPSGIMEF